MMFLTVFAIYLWIDLNSGLFVIHNIVRLTNIKKICKLICVDFFCLCLILKLGIRKLYEFVSGNLLADNLDFTDCQEALVPGQIMASQIRKGLINFMSGVKTMINREQDKKRRQPNHTKQQLYPYSYTTLYIPQTYQSIANQISQSYHGNAPKYTHQSAPCQPLHHC